GSKSKTALKEIITVYCNDHSPYIVKWPILNDFSIYDDQQNAFADAFTNYLWVQKTLEGAWLGE
ncbi:MAG: hypothetical protein ACI3ZE_06100, partial [Candidatus Woodwardiibium sp.]